MQQDKFNYLGSLDKTEKMFLEVIKSTCSGYVEVKHGCFVSSVYVEHV